jgi:HEAT repeat protein
LIGLLRDEDANVRNAAARALGEIGTAETGAVVGLVRMLGEEADSQPTGGARLSTRERRPQSPDDPTPLGVAVVTALGKIARKHPDSVITALSDFIGREKSNVVAHDGVASVLKSIERPSDEHSVSQLMHLLDRAPNRVRAAAAGALAHTGEAQAAEVAEKLMTLVGDGDPEIRMASISSIAAIMVMLATAESRGVVRMVPLLGMWTAPHGLLSPSAGFLKRENTLASSKKQSRRDLLRKAERCLLPLLSAGDAELRATATQAFSRMCTDQTEIVTALVGLLGDDTRLPERFGTDYDPSLNQYIGKKVSDISADALLHIGAVHPGQVATSLKALT